MMEHIANILLLPPGGRKHAVFPVSRRRPLE
jgi:hypothetical protein